MLLFHRTRGLYSNTEKHDTVVVVVAIGQDRVVVVAVADRVPESTAAAGTYLECRAYHT